MVAEGWRGRHREKLITAEKKNKHIFLDQILEGVQLKEDKKETGIRKQKRNKEENG